ncbi:hypothetical protein FXO37_07692 [Capsicum annuum]|nr:hypothetical protein FXO37_07692 [Capsicum annuum]
MPIIATWKLGAKRGYRGGFLEIDEFHFGLWRDAPCTEMAFVLQQKLKIAITSSPGVRFRRICEKDYNVITMRSRDRPKLLFDIVCSLTGMQYVVFHGVVHIRKMEAYQEFYIQHIDGLPISSEGPELELCTEDRLGLLSHITRILRKNGLCAERAEISTFLSRMCVGVPHRGGPRFKLVVF